MNNEIMVNNIKELCKNESITVTRLEEILGFSQGLIGRWKDKSPSIDRLVDIADHFHVSIDSLIGRTMITKNPFLETIYNRTNNGTFKWSKVTQQDAGIITPRDFKLYDEEVYNEIYYYTRFETGYFTMRCFSEYSKTFNPIELNFYIQPSDDSGVVPQDHTTEQLLPLWILILNKVEDVPDEVKAQNMIQKLLQQRSLGERIAPFTQSNNQ